MAASFPSPVGGTTLSSDFAPCIVFAVVFALIVPVLVYRAIFDKKSRSMLLINAMLTLGERPVVFALRANQSRHLGSQASAGLMKYFQLSFALGYVGLTQDLCKLLRSALVHATSPPEPTDDSAPDQVQDMNMDSIKVEDHPRTRFWARRITDFYNFAYIAAIVPGVVSSLQLSGSINSADPSRSDRVIAMRYACAIIHLALTIPLAAYMYWAMTKFQRISREAGWIFISTCLILCIPGLYRVGVMHNRTLGNVLSGSPDTPGALNRPVDKALFYIFHIVPEGIVAVMLFIKYNLRELFKTGFAGDILWRDLTPEEKEKARKKREEKKAKKEAKKAAKRGLVVDEV